MFYPQVGSCNSKQFWWITPLLKMGPHVKGYHYIFTCVGLFFLYLTSLAVNLLSYWGVFGIFFSFLEMLALLSDWVNIIGTYVCMYL